MCRGGVNYENRSKIPCVARPALIKCDLSNRGDKYFHKKPLGGYSTANRLHPGPWQKKTVGGPGFKKKSGCIFTRPKTSINSPRALWLGPQPINLNMRRNNRGGTFFRGETLAAYNITNSLPFGKKTRLWGHFKKGNPAFK